MIIKINWLPLAAEGILGSFGPLLGGVLVPSGPYCVIGLDEKTPLNPPQGVCSGFPKSRDGYHLGASLLGFGFVILQCARLSPKAGGSSVLLPRGAWEHQRSRWVPSPLFSFFFFCPFTSCACSFISKWLSSRGHWELQGNNECEVSALHRIIVLSMFLFSKCFGSNWV